MNQQQPKIAIVTPWNGYHAEWLDTCWQSVEKQTLQVDHLMIFDGLTPDPYAFRDKRVIVLPDQEHGPLRKFPPSTRRESQQTIGHGDAGNLARGIGGILCAAEGYDAVTYLDADNWIEPDHIARLWDLQQTTGSPVVSARRVMHHLDGSKLYDEESEHAAGHVDTNCMFFHRGAFALLSLWTQIPRVVAPIGDQFFWKMVCAWLKGQPLLRARSDVPSLGGAPTVHYRTGYAAHYRAVGMEPPAGATKEIDIKTAYRLNFNATSVAVEL